MSKKEEEYDAMDASMDEELETAAMDGMLAEAKGFSARERSDDIKAKQIRISSQINIVWLIG